MRRAVLSLAAAVLLGGSTVIAFFSGGYFDGPRIWTALVAWALVLVVALAGPRPLPHSRAGRAAVAGLALLTAWSAASLAWAPIAGPAIGNVQRLLLYVGVLIAAAALLRPRRVAAAVEPALALGTFVVIGYGIAGRLLPAVIEQAHSARAGGRLDQPLTYWNAEGALAAIGLVLCAHLAGDHTRRPAVRALAAAAFPVLGLGIYLSYSRGAIVAAILGCIVLLAAVPTWPQLRATGAAVVASVLASVCAAAFPAVANLSGHRAAQEHDGAIVLGALVAVMLAAACSSLWAASGRRRDGRLPGARRLPVVATLTAALTLAGLVAGGLAEHGNGASAADRQDVSRLTTLQSNRYEYWRVGVRAFGEHPLLGLGSGGFRVFWTQQRPIAESVLDVHSLELEMATELGAPGLLALALLLGGLGAATGRAVRRRPAVAGGWCAACVVWLAHATIDWDWQMPGVTLPVLVIAGALIAVAEETAGALPSSDRDDAVAEPAEPALSPTAS